MKPISSEELKQIQLQILKNVHEFCEKQDIKYTLAYGTLLGSIRHKGFIPWDNDIDIAMLREDYERFIVQYSDVIYKVYELRTDNKCDIPYAKVYDTRTIHKEHASLNTIGVNIDIFPMDNLYDDYNYSIKKYKKFNLLKYIRLFKGRRSAPTTRLLKKILLYMGKLIFLGIDSRKICKINSYKAQFNSNNNTKYVGLLVGNSTSLNNVMERDIYRDRILVKFEDSKFWAINKYHEYLTKTYGDYMTPPPIEDRSFIHYSENIYWI